MEIRIKETGEIEDVYLIDPKTGICWVSDFMGSPDELEYNDESGIYEMSQADFDWWENVIKAYQHASDRAHEFRAEFGKEEIDDLLNDATASVDVDMIAPCIEGALDQYLADKGLKEKVYSDNSIGFEK